MLLQSLETCSALPLGKVRGGGALEGRSLVAPGLQHHLLLQCVSVLRAADLLTSFVVKNMPVDVSKKATGLFRCYASSSSHFNLVIPLKLCETACSLRAAESAPITQVCCPPTS